MARIPRVTQKIFAGSATNNGVFGSAQASGGTLSNVLATIMGLAAWNNGWLSAVIGGSKFPPLEEFQSVEYVHSTQIAYLLQEGIPEYDAGTTYFTHNWVKAPGTDNIYSSLIDNNTGNALTNTSDWKLVFGGATTAPTQQILKTGTAATYTTPTGVVRLKVRMKGGGGGGSSDTGTGGGTGGTTSFGTFTALGGTGGGNNVNPHGGTGGGGGTGSADLRLNGSGGSSGFGGTTTASPGGQGAPGYNGNGAGNGGGGATANGTDAAPNTGGGGGGGQGAGTTASGGGGGAGEDVWFTIASPAGTYTYTVAAGGTGGTGGATGQGGVGGTGLIIVDEYYY